MINKPYLPSRQFIDSRFPLADDTTMRAAVGAAQQERATIAGPPVPAPSFSLQGVEKRAADNLQAQRDLGPMRPMIVNGVPSFTPAAAPAATPRPAPMIPPTVAQAPVMRQAPLMQAPLPAPANSLSRGAAPRGLGGVAPTPTGRSRFDPQRMAEMMVRRRDPRGAQFLFGQAMQAQGQGFQREMFGAQQQAEGVRDERNFQQGLQMFGAQQQAMQERDALNFQQQQQMFQQEGARRAGESDLEWQRRQEAEAAQRAAEGDPTQITTQQIPGTGYVIPFAGKKAMGTLPLVKEQPPLPAGLVPQGAVRDGVQYGPAQTANAKAPSFTYEKDPNGRITGAVYPVQDPQTGQWKLQRADLNGDGVVDPQEAAAASAGAPAQGAAVKTKAGNSYSFK